jgi:hypothetical protein
MADSLTFAVFPVDGGFGYEVSENGARIIVQHNDPDLPGNEAMSEARATEAAQAVIDRMSAAE